MVKKILPSIVFVLLAISCRGEAASLQLRDGDLIFQTSRSAQSVAIQKATHSRYSHMGIIFFRDGKPYVCEAIKTVQYSPLNKWIARGDGGHYIIKRLHDAGRILTPNAVTKLRYVAKKFRGRPYDLTFEWSDDRIYCSELIWKIYDRGIGVQVGRLQQLRDFDLSDPVVKAKMQERYGNRVPMDETVISPGEMFSSKLLIVVIER